MPTFSGKKFLKTSIILTIILNVIINYYFLISEILNWEEKICLRSKEKLRYEQTTSRNLEYESERADTNYNQ